MNSTILHWLNLEEGVFLELEAGEDIDIVRADLNQPEDNLERLLTQLKQISDGSLTLRNRDALKSVANFSGHREANPEWNLRFRFVTTLPIGEERDGWDFSHSAIRTWERIRLSEASEEERTGGIAALLSFLRDREKPASFSPETWATLQRMLNGQATYTFAEFVGTFEWSTGSGDYLDVKRQVLECLERLLPGGSPEAAAEKFDHLFAFVFERLCEPGQKRLDAAMLEERLASSEVSLRVPCLCPKAHLAA